MAEISGIWYFKSTISRSSDYGSTYQIEEVKYLSNGTNWIRMYCPIAQTNLTGLTYQRYNHDTGGVIGTNACEFSSGKTTSSAWVATAYRTVDFGGIPQTVSDIFYNYIAGNAIYQGASTTTFDSIEFYLPVLQLTGTHSITVKARGAGYNDSPASEAVQYTA